MPQPVMLKKLKLKGSMKHLQDPLELTTTTKNCPFHHRGLECKSRQSRDTWSNRQVWLWSIRWRRAKANWLTEFYQANTLVIANTLFQQPKRWLYTWTSPDGQYWNQTDYVLCSQRWRRFLYSQQKQDLELTVTEIMSLLLQNTGFSWRKGKPLGY